ncbi:uncharacterized protein LOC100902254 [Galendromus occidentalis]|uniref:Uncharacterized protein LOC100902254 n=1 Tax=Galendromus occidentalis TaxID=34638 RepID=A0AAJ6QP42_9ACAR|nr:uncharacterized protein LOC100902254 [Galendromus occidentalis]
MNDEVSFQDGLRVARAQLLRRMLVQAILKLETEIGDGEKEKFCNFKASVILRLFSIKPPLQGFTPFDSEFYTERIVPELNAILSKESAPLGRLEVCTENDVIEAYSRLRKQMKELVQRRQTLNAHIQASKELLNRTLRHEQWSLRFKLEQAQVDYTAVTAAVYEKKFGSIAKSILDLFRDYRYDEALESIREKLESEKTALARELDRRIKKHEIYKKALVLNPDLDDVLEKYQSLTDSLVNMRKMSSVSYN